MKSRFLRLALVLLLVAAGAFLGRATGGEEPEPTPTVKAVRVVMGGIDIDQWGRKFYTATLYFPDCGAMVKFRIDGPTGKVGPAKAIRNATPWWDRLSKGTGIIEFEVKKTEYRVPKKLVDDVIALAMLQANLSEESARISREAQAAGLLEGAVEHAGGLVPR